MRKIPHFYIGLLLLLLYPRILFSQENGAAITLSLEEAIKTGLQNNLSSQINGLQTSLSTKQIEVAKSQKIPELFGNFDLRRNLIVPTTPVPAIAFDPNAAPGKMMPMRFATDWSSSAGLNLNYDIFSPQSNGQVKEAQQKEKIQQLDAAANELNLRYQIESDYVACLIAQKQLELAITDTIQQKQIAAIAKMQYQEGKIDLTGYNRIVSNLQKSQSNYLSAQKVFNVAQLQLLSDLGYPLEKDIQLTDNLEQILNNKRQNTSGETGNISTLQLNAQRSLTDLQLKNAKDGFAPTLSLKGFLGGNYYENNFRLFNSQNWFGNSFIGLSLTVPITKDLSRAKDIQSLQIQQEIDQLQIRQKARETELQTKKAMEDVAFREKDLSIKEKDYQIQKSNFETAQAKFENGKITTIELLQNDFQYQQAKTTYLQALYDLILSRIDLEKARSL